MTQATPDVLAVDLEDWKILGGIAGEAARPPEVFLEEGLIIALAAAERICANRAAHKPQTYLFIGSPEAGLSQADDLEAILRGGDSEEPTEDDLGFENPFASDAEVTVDLPAMLLEKVAAASGSLGVSRETLVKVGVDLRYLLHAADLNGEVVLLDTPNPEEFDLLPSGFAD